MVVIIYYGRASWYAADVQISRLGGEVYECVNHSRYSVRSNYYMQTAKLDCLIFICFLRGKKHKNFLSPSRIYPILYVGRYVRSPRSDDRCPGTKIQESTQPVPGEAVSRRGAYIAVPNTVPRTTVQFAHFFGRICLWSDSDSVERVADKSEAASNT